MKHGKLSRMIMMTVRTQCKRLCTKSHLIIHKNFFSFHTYAYIPSICPLLSLFKVLSSGTGMLWHRFMLEHERARFSPVQTFKLTTTCKYWTCEWMEMENLLYDLHCLWIMLKFEVETFTWEGEEKIFLSSSSFKARNLVDKKKFFFCERKKNIMERNHFILV